MKYEFYSGSYGEPGEDGIIRFCLDTEKGSLERTAVYRDIRRPSYLGIDASKTILYAVQEEVPSGFLHALAIQPDGLWPVCALSTQGADPCHIASDRFSHSLFTANYTSGSLAIFQTGEDAMPVALSQLIRHKGHGLCPKRQEAPHIHCAKILGNQVFVVDLGLDQVFVYQLDKKRELWTDTGKRLCLPPGSGPRHLEFHPSVSGLLYVVCELSSQVAVFRETGADYSLAQLLPTLPEDFHGENTTAAIKAQRNLLFVSNRGHDSIAVYRILENGLLELAQIISSGGKAPRDFSVIGNYLAIANQDSDNITILKINHETGNLEPTGIWAPAVKPCCILNPAERSQP